jgi:hypothetical protein
MTKQPVLELVVLILMMGAFALPARLVAGKDPFSGFWRLNVEKSDTRLPVPKAVRIKASGKAFRVREEVANQNRARETVATINADFNGKDYPVIGSPLADTAACERLDDHTIIMTVKKQGNLVVTEKLMVSPDGKTLTASFRNFTGVAVFDKH